MCLGLGGRGGTCEIEDEDGTDSILEVAGDQRAVAFLSGGVPELETAGGGVVSYVFAEEVDADSGLGGDGGTLSFYSNLLFTNRSIMLVLPVLLSPRRITLKVRLPIVELVIDIAI